MSRKNHVHKVKRKTYSSGNSIYFCILDGCSFKVECDLYLGKMTICHTCGCEFIATEYTLKLKRPHCPNCGKVRIVDSDGTKRYIRKETATIMSSIADDTVNDLKNRLSTIVESLTTSDEDI